MLKKFGMSLLALLLVSSLAFVGCGGDDDDGDKFEPFELLLGDNYQYGDGYQGRFPASTFTKYFTGFAKNAVYEIDMEFTVSGTAWADGDEELFFGIVDTAANGWAGDGKYWHPLTWDPDAAEDNEGTSAGTAEELIAAGTTNSISKTVTLTVADHDFTADDTTLIFQFSSSRGTKGDGGSGSDWERTLNFSKFTVTKQ